MSRCWAPALLALFLASTSPAVAQVADKASEAARIETDCGLKKGSIRVTGNEVQLIPSPDENYEHVDCAIDRLSNAGLGKLGFVGNEANPNAVLNPPLRYIAEGSSAQIGALLNAMPPTDWVIRRTAKASDGTSIVEFESGPNTTEGRAERFLHRIWKKEFGDIAFGYTPRKLSDPNP